MLGLRAQSFGRVYVRQQLLVFGVRILGEATTEAATVPRPTSFVGRNRGHQYVIKESGPGAILASGPFYIDWTLLIV